MIEISRVRHAFAGQRVLHAPDFRVETGNTLLVVGESGSGKSTLLHCLGGLLRPDEGAVVFDGLDLAGLGDGQLDRVRGAQIGIVFQDLHLMPALSVNDNLRLAQSLSGAGVDQARIDETLDRLGVAHLSHVKPRRLSRGEAQRAAIARAVVHRPKLLLADEPTSALDDANTQRVIDLLRAEASLARATLIIATHDHRLREQFDAQIELLAPAAQVRAA